MVSEKRRSPSSFMCARVSTVSVNFSPRRSAKRLAMATSVVRPSVRRLPPFVASARTPDMFGRGSHRLGVVTVACVIGLKENLPAMRMAAQEAREACTEWPEGPGVRGGVLEAD